MKYINSPIEKIKFNDFSLYLKRDDLLDESFSGNKARKLYYFLENDFPDIQKVVSYGSSQSNAMYSLSVLCRLKGWNFDYYVDHIADFLKQNPNGNYKAALENGMKIYEKEVPKIFDKNTLFISEGAALKEASFGISVLAQEIKTWAMNEKIENLKVFLPSGTGTTALYLQRYLPFEVLTCACVADEEYLKKQFLLLEKDKHPTIIKREKKYHFGKLYNELYETYKELLKQTDIEFDLLYDPVGFITLQNYLNKQANKEQLNVLYIHQGGILGNTTMLERYKRKYERNT